MGRKLADTTPPVPDTPAAPKVDTAILDAVAKDRGAQLWQETQKAYPIMAKQDLAFKYAPVAKPPYMLEFYQGGDLPSWAKGKTSAVEIMNAKTKPSDILADWVSHYGVTKDPQIAPLYKQFVESMTPEQKSRLAKQYKDYSQGYYMDEKGNKVVIPGPKETRPYEKWAELSGIPAYMRGYTFDQWKDSKDWYTPQQLQYLDQIRSITGYKSPTQQTR